MVMVVTKMLMGAGKRSCCEEWQRLVGLMAGANEPRESAATSAVHGVLIRRLARRRGRRYLVESANNARCRCEPLESARMTRTVKRFDGNKERSCETSRSQRTRTESRLLVSGATKLVDLMN